MEIPVINCVVPSRDKYSQMSDLITICVSGQTFLIRRSCLYRWPNSRLYMLAVNPEEHAECLITQKDEFGCAINSNISRRNLSRSSNTLYSNSKNLLSSPLSHQANSDIALNRCDSAQQFLEENSSGNHHTIHNAQETIYYYDRDPEIFRFVLDYYRTGELHLPSNICGPFVRKELIYWGIDESFILPCCMPAYMRYDEERRIKKSLFKDCFEDIDSMQNLVNCCRGLKRWRYRLWLFLDHPSSSLPAKTWAAILLVLTIGSVLCYCLTTHDTFRDPMTFNLISNRSGFCQEGLVTDNPKLYKDCTTVPNRLILRIDVALNILFTFEYFFKIALAPDRKRFLINFISLLDATILTTFWLNQIVYYYCYVHDEGREIREGSEVIPMWVLKFLNVCQALRILRIFKISKISRGLRVLMLTVKKSIPELVLLAFLLMNGMFMFSSMIYMAEYNVNDTFTDIPEAFWWSIVTLTTVGYGDAYPKGGAGYFVGSIAAVSGCVVTGLAIPIIGNNFNTYYKYMQNQLKEDKYLRILRKNFSNMSVTQDTGVIPLVNRKYLQLRGELKPSNALYTERTRSTADFITRRRTLAQQINQNIQQVNNGLSWRNRASMKFRSASPSKPMEDYLKLNKRNKEGPHGFNTKSGLKGSSFEKHSELRIDMEELPDYCLDQDALNRETTEAVTLRLATNKIPRLIKMVIPPPNTSGTELLSSRPNYMNVRDNNTKYILQTKLKNNISS